MDRHYVSEFTRFMEAYLAEHPEIVRDQKIGWNIYWNHPLDFAALKEAEEDSVPDDGYGFHPLAVRGGRH